MNTDLIRTIIASNIPRKEQDILILLVIDNMNYYEPESDAEEEQSDEEQESDTEEHESDAEEEQSDEEQESDTEEQESVVCSGCHLRADSEKLWGLWSHKCQNCSVKKRKN